MIAAQNTQTCNRWGSGACCSHLRKTLLHNGIFQTRFRNDRVLSNPANCEIAEDRLERAEQSLSRQKQQASTSEYLRANFQSAEMACEATVAITTCAVACSSTDTLATAVLRAVSMVTRSFEGAAGALGHLR